MTATLWNYCWRWWRKLAERKGPGFEDPRPLQGEERHSRGATRLVNGISTLCSLTRLSIHPSGPPRSNNQLPVMGQVL